jgi:hypothetical protein
VPYPICTCSYTINDSSNTYTMHKNNIWTSSAGMAILAAEVVNVLIVFVLFKVVGLTDGTLANNKISKTN